jgi:hypothetical protein
MNISDFRGGLKLAVVVNGCLFIVAMITKSVDLAKFLFNLVWMAGLVMTCSVACWLYRTHRAGQSE